MADDFIPGKTVCIHLIHKSESGKIKTGVENVTGINPNPDGGGVFDIACSPGSGIPTHATSETVAVTCPMCKATPIFKELNDAQQNSGNGSDADKAAIKYANELKAKRLVEIAAEVPVKTSVNQLTDAEETE